MHSNRPLVPACMTALGNDRYRCGNRGITITTTVLPIMCCGVPAPPFSDSVSDYLDDPTMDVSSGTGTNLRKLLHRFFLTARASCKCGKRANEMDQKGPDWCEKNIELIVDWLQEEAEKRKLPFMRLAGKALVKLAIRKARKAEKKATT